MRCRSRWRSSTNATCRPCASPPTTRTKAARPSRRAAPHSSRGAEMQGWEDALSVAAALPHGADRAPLGGPGGGVRGPGGGPTLVTVRDGQLLDIGGLAPTMSALLDRADAAQAVQAAAGRTL